MKIRKITFTILLAVLALLLVGCSSNKGELKADFTVNGNYANISQSGEYALGDHVIAYKNSSSTLQNIYLLSADGCKEIATKLRGTLSGIRIWNNHVYYAVFLQENTDFYDYDISSRKTKKVHSTEGITSTSWAVVDGKLVFESLNGNLHDGEKYTLTVCEDGKERAISENSLGFTYINGAIQFVEGQGTECVLKSFDLTTHQTTESTAFTCAGTRAYISDSLVLTIPGDMSKKYVNVYFKDTKELKKIELSEYPMSVSVVDEYLFFIKGDSKNVCRLNTKTAEEITLSEGIHGELYADSSSVVYVYDFESDCINRVEIDKAGKTRSTEIADIK